MYNAWQASLVLARLGGALRVSMARKSPILALALQAYKGNINISPQLGSFKEESH